MSSTAASPAPDSLSLLHDDITHSTSVTTLKTVSDLQIEDLRDSLHRRRREQASKVKLNVTKDVDASQPGDVKVHIGVEIDHDMDWPMYGYHILTWIKGIRWAAGPRPSYHVDDLPPGHMATAVDGTHPDRDFGDDDIHVALVFDDHDERRWVVHEGGFLQDITGKDLDDAAVFARRVRTAGSSGYGYGQGPPARQPVREAGSERGTTS